MKNVTQILIVEDNEGDIALSVEAFSEAKVPVMLNVVMDGEEVMLYLRKQGKYSDAMRPDIILLDLNLPKKNGCAILQEIKTDPLFKSIPIIVLTSSGMEKDILSAYDHYANCYIRKPFDLNKLIEVVKRIEKFWLTIVKLPSRPV